MALITGALTALMFALIRRSALGWASPAIVALFATAAVAFAGFVTYELRIAAAPMADLHLPLRVNAHQAGTAAREIRLTPIGAGGQDRRHDNCASHRVCLRCCAPSAGLITL